MEKGKIRISSMDSNSGEINYLLAEEERELEVVLKIASQNHLFFQILHSEELELVVMVAGGMDLTGYHDRYSFVDSFCFIPNL